MVNPTKPENIDLQLSVDRFPSTLYGVQSLYAVSYRHKASARMSDKIFV